MQVTAAPTDPVETDVDRMRREWGEASGTTLVEVLVVVAIIVLLAGIVSSTVVLGKTRATLAVDLSNMHQLGVAANIYESDHDDRQTMRVAQLIDSGLVPEGVCSSPLDRLEGGYVRQFMDHIGVPQDFPRPKWKVSYVGLGDGMWQEPRFVSTIADRPNPGWLVCLVRGQSTRLATDGSLVEVGAALRTGLYHRLLTTGSVVARYQGKLFIKDEADNVGAALKVEDFFADPK